MIGAWADTAPSRLTVVFKGCFVQGCTSALTVFFLAALLSLGPEAATTGPAALGHLSGGALVLFGCIAVCGVAEALAAGAVSVAVEKDWVPAVFERVSGRGNSTADDAGGGSGAAAEGAAAEGSEDADELTAVNAAMSRIDLCAEFAGPVLAGACLWFFGPAAPLRGFACVGFANALSFAPQYVLLRGLYASCDRLRLPKEPPPAGPTAPPAAEAPAAAAPALRETSALVAPETTQQGLAGWCRVACREQGVPGALKAWPVWLRHPGGVPLVSIAYALLYFTALSPHGIPLTAYLASRGGVEPLALAVFRGCGAAAGILGLTTFELLKDRVGLRAASVAHLAGQCACVLGAACAFDAGGTELFMAGVVASRVGLYGFDVGFMELQQRNVEEKARNAVGAVDQALTSVAEFAVYACALHVTSASAMAGLTWASAASVAAALGVFAAYLLLWRETAHGHDGSHTHDAASGDSIEASFSVLGAHVGPGAAHRHTTQQRRALKADGTHAHVHYVGPNVCGRSSGGGSSAEGHDHAHDHNHL